MLSVTITEKDGPSSVQTFDSTKSEVLIGRIKGNDIVLGRSNISKRHSRIVVKDGKIIVIDLKSTNGTFVNGEKITGTLYEYTENTTEIYGHQNTEVSQKTIDGVRYLLVRGQTTGKGVMRIGSWAKVRTPLSTLGDASASDVAAGKTFTSAAGLKVTGTREDSGGISIVSDGEGNVTITASGSAAITSDGNGNAAIEGGVS